MKQSDNFHDGHFEGVWTDRGTAYILLTEESGAQFAIVSAGVEALSLTGFRAGNIVLDVEIRQSDEVTEEDISELYELVPGPTGESQCRKLLDGARAARLSLLVVSPSYGGECLVLAKAFETVKREDWLGLVTGGAHL